MFRTAALLLLIAAAPLRAATTVTLLHFSDYHSHALPFYSEGSMSGGIARAIGFMERHRRDGALVFNGGDMMNKSAPAWSDKYHCVEWAWLNGVVDAMAFGNHDADYGNEEFNRCRALIRYPILSANTAGFERYRVFERNGIRIGVFAVAGPDFADLVTNATFLYSDPVAAAREVVETLRAREHVDAVVMIGHEHVEENYRLAALVPGIDLIFGSHTHLKRDLTTIPGTHTAFISPFQYGTYVSVVELHVRKHRVTKISGRLVSVDSSVAPDPEVERHVAKMEGELESDPAYRGFFVAVAKMARPMEVDTLAKFTVETMRDVVHADVALSTASSFRQALPAGTLLLETLRQAMPYDNEIVVAQLTGVQLQRVLERAATKDLASDARSFSTAAPAIDPSRMYAVAVTDYMARVSLSYRDVFTQAKITSTKLHVRTEVMKRLGDHAP